MFSRFWNRQKTILLVVMLVLGVVAMIFTTHNQSFYHQPVGVVTSVKNGHPQKQVDQFKNVDHLTSQTLQLRLENSRYQGQTVKVANTFSDSQGTDLRYRVKDQVLLTQLHKSKGHLTANVSGPKRDVVIVFLAWLVVTMLLVMMGRSGSFALLSVVINAILLFIAIKINVNNQATAVLLIFSLLALLFAVVSLLLVIGPSKRMLATLGATILGTAAAMLISAIVLWATKEKGVYYESMQYVTQVPKPLFLAETLLGSLGAVMDESSDISATLFQLKRLNPDISGRELFIAGRNVGKSIMGPLINVLFFIFMADTFTPALLYIKNGNSWGYTFAMNMCLGTVQSLISGIGIVLAIPLASGLMAILLGRRETNDHN